MAYLFVYGTLLKHERNDHFLREATRLVRQASVRGQLYDTYRNYPIATLESESRIYGELYDVPTPLWPELDKLEGYVEDPSKRVFDRSQVLVSTDVGTVTAWVYHTYEADLNPNWPALPYNDWKLHLFHERKPASVSYFAYGSCMDQERFKDAGVASYFTTISFTGTLYGCDLQYTIYRPDGGRADVVETNNPKDWVEGLVYHCPQAALDYLYKREGVDQNWYRPAIIDVEDEKGRTHSHVLTFFVIDKVEEAAPPAHYSEEILRGALNNVSLDYQTRLQTKIDQLNESMKKLP
ncbi:gamma-glutamylcyclotransferase [Salsuginibacillus kocurii]|uniref:gamma-glutamylcyclotransferase n=1 Tax=Salsuginibacillus kocurii TaxID=427078 RepID=UPI000373E940|nr:gamma-glutamylcyclotransferase family protein [Salsuginibacillus kocurii]